MLHDVANIQNNVPWIHLPHHLHASNPAFHVHCTKSPLTQIPKSHGKLESLAWISFIQCAKAAAHVLPLCARRHKRNEGCPCITSNHGSTILRLHPHTCVGVYVWAAPGSYSSNLYGLFTTQVWSKCLHQGAGVVKMVKVPGRGRGNSNNGQNAWTGQRQ